ncbi:MAG: hypothetical protein ACR2KV_07430 [Solirubrobacteraceae bacterium]
MSPATTATKLDELRVNTIQTLALTRRAPPVIDPDLIPVDAIEWGAYILGDAGEDPSLSLTAAGASAVVERARRLLVEGAGELFARDRAGHGAGGER